MPNIEQVIRHALEKIDATNSVLREKVYRAAWETHERNITSDKHLSDEDLNALRDMLVRLIKSIENEYRLKNNETFSKEDATLSQPYDQEPINETDHFNSDDINSPRTHTSSAQDQRQLDPNLGIKTKNSAKTTLKAVDPHATGPEELSPPPKSGFVLRQQKQRPWWRSNIILMILLILLLLVVWAFYNSLTTIHRPTNTNNQASAPVISNNEQRQSAQNNGWITVFDPASINDFSLEGAAKAQIIHDGDMTALRLKNNNNVNDRVIINVGEGVVEKLRGKTVTFNIVARSANNKASQISIACDFGANDSCAKRIFDLHQVSEDLLFSVEFPQDINKNGQIFLQSALLDSQYEIDILSVRVRIEN